MEVGGAVNGCGMGRGPVRRRDSLLPPGRVSLRRKGLRGFPIPPGPTDNPSHGKAAAGSAPSRPFGGEGGGVRWCPPPCPPAPPSPSPPLPPPSPRAGLSLPSPPLLPPAASSCRCRCFGCCVIRPRAAGTEGLGLGTPRPLPALSPTSRRALPARGGSPRSPTSASARLPVSPAVTGPPRMQWHSPPG